MTELTDDEIKNQLERSQRKRKLALEVAEDNDSPPTSALSRRCRETGIYTLLLGDLDEALNWFGKAADWFEKDWEKTHGKVNEPQVAMWALFTGVLSQKEKLIIEIATKIIKKGIKYQDPKYYVYLDKCLINLLLENDEAALEMAEMLTELGPELPKEVGSYPGFGAACRAILNRDVSEFNVALRDMLNHHDELEEQRAEGLDHIVVCIPATVLLLIARDRGLPIEETEALQSEHVPAELFE